MESIQIRLERLIDRFGKNWSISKKGNLLSLCLRYACTEMPNEFLGPKQVHDKLLELCTFSEEKSDLLNLISRFNGNKFVKSKQAILILIIKLAQQKAPKSANKSPFALERQNPTGFPDFQGQPGGAKGTEAGDSDVLFRDILSVYQGIDNLNIVYSRKFDMYILGKDSKLEMTTSAQKMLSSLCEIGWLYRVISLNLNKLMKRRNSLIVQSFYTAIKDQLNEFYRHIMILDVHYRRVYLGANRFFLCRLKKFNQDTEFRMKALAELVNAGLPLEPHQILSYLYTISRNALPQEHYSLSRLAELAHLLEHPDHKGHSGFGSFQQRPKPRSKMKLKFTAEEIQEKVNSPLMVFNSIGVNPGLEENQMSFDPKAHRKWAQSKGEQDFLLGIFRKSCKSLVEFVNTWVFRGEILDPKGEFFVQLNTSLPNSDKFWDSGMFFMRAKVPSFLNQEDAEMIFKTGKIQRLFKKLEQGGFGSEYLRGRRSLLVTQKHYTPKRKTIFWTRIKSHVDNDKANSFRDKNRIELDEMVATNNSQSLNSKLGLFFAYSNSLLLHHFFVDRNGLLIFQFLKMTFLLTRGDFASAFLDSIYFEIGFQRPRHSMIHQLMMCLEQAVSSSIKQNVENPYADEFGHFYEESPPQKAVDRVATLDSVIELQQKRGSLGLGSESGIRGLDEEGGNDNQIREERVENEVASARNGQIFGDEFRSQYSRRVRIKEEEEEKFLLCDDLRIRFFEKQKGFKHHFINFSLNLPEFEFPLNNVFSQSLLRKYSIIFQYLFSLKTVQYRLRQFWVHNSKIMKRRHNARLSRLFLLLHAFQGKLRSFFDGLLDYYLVDVIAVCWDTFCDELSRVRDFEKLIQLHQTFVFQILEKLSLDLDNEANKKRRVRIQAALAQIFRNFEEYVQVQQFVFKNLVDAESEDSDSSMLGDEQLQSAHNKDSIIKESFKHLFKIEKRFSAAVIEFTYYLKEKEFDIRNDFNEYYARETRSFS